MLIRIKINTQLSLSQFLGRNIIWRPTRFYPRSTFIQHFCFRFILVLSDVEFASYADDNTPYVVKNIIKSVIKSLENTSVELFEWFSDNQMKANPNKCHFRTSESKDLVIDVENNQITNSKCEKLFGIK